jgi:hypothetical protein
MIDKAENEQRSWIGNAAHGKHGNGMRDIV